MFMVHFKKLLRNMKRLLPIAAIALTAALFTSCKKDYTCTCQWKDNGTVIQTQTFTFNASKSDAKKSCNNQATISGGGSTMTVSCNL
jgi:hypothetical protein